MNDVATESADSLARKHRWRLILALTAVFAVVWFIRAAMWPCGALDRTSGCVSSVMLDVEALGHDPSAAWANLFTFDLSPGGKTALVSMMDKPEAGQRSTLAVFDAKTGALLQLLYNEINGAFFEEAALSPDATLAAASYRTGRDGTLAIYRVADGSVIKTLKKTEGGEPQRFHCQAMLAFSPDNTKLQCGSELFDIASGTASSLVEDNEYTFPLLAAFNGTFRSTASDGTRIEPPDLNSPLNLFDAQVRVSFAPDSVGLLEVWLAYGENRGQRFFTPSVFRRMSAVGVWDGKTKELKRSFYANRRYVLTAWSRDSAYFGLITDDLRLEVFKR
ncbi:WD40 repeat domain-containing protein [Tabrizicola sp.]|uniref:WD40 repeat domain-containing protein n=1 Tax=Tabrizicola sp. TaxID=2005166 RepID=UPI003F3937D2